MNERRGRCFVCGKRRLVEVFDEEEDGVLVFTELCREHRPSQEAA